MPRKRVIREQRFGERDYLINVTATSGVYEGHIQRVIDLMEACFAKGRWTALHLRYTVGDGATNDLVLNSFRNRLGRKNMRYLWAYEHSDQDNGRSHYHLALFINSREKRMAGVPAFLRELKAKDLIWSYHRMTPDLSKAPPELMQELDSEHINQDATGYGLDLNSIAAVRYGVYWLSYLAKVKTKQDGVRTFGSSSLPKGWQDDVYKVMI